MVLSDQLWRNLRAKATYASGGLSRKNVSQPSTPLQRFILQEAIDDARKEIIPRASSINRLKIIHCRHIVDASVLPDSAASLAQRYNRMRSIAGQKTYGFLQISGTSQLHSFLVIGSIHVNLR